MNSTRLILNTTGWVYLRSTKIEQVWKIGKSNADGLKRASIHQSKILRLNMSLNNHLMEKILIKVFNTKFEKYCGNEYFVGEMFDIIKTFDEVFSKHEKEIFNDLMITKPLSTIYQYEDEVEPTSDDECLGRLRKRKRT